ncbi:6-phosphogluconolactonase [Algoriphagus mannitolivorans]|uniref:6-phosphogluconolactonase n=1 Tax=Algoriphagus mannitolivorans TaxID=226504 RepID=UPI0003FED3D9|nr:6-phosphogluconolactonase [Algoriphagus mannitolivorans]
MKIESHPDSLQVAESAAKYLEQKIRDSIKEKGSFSMAISGGKTPWQMLKLLAKAPLPWSRVNIFQVDEREAADGHPDRNLTQLFKTLEGTGIITKVNIFPMPVVAENLEEACADYANTIKEITGDGILDLVHLGMGADGHTASLIPGDQVCEVYDKDVAMTASPYQGRNRMTLTYPVINKAKEILWVITGEEKKEMVQRLISKDPNIPAGKVSQENALLITDQV